MTPGKAYDEEYFQRWYRPGVGSWSPEGTLRRQVAAAVAVTELVIDRPLRSVLDVGCGEGRWQPEVFALRPDASYLGIDPSEYVLERFGEPRNIRSGTFGSLELHDFQEPFDLVVCADVLHYLKRREIREGLPALVARVGGVACLDVFTRSDDVEGDLVDFHRRPASAYREMFTEAGLCAIGLHFYVPGWRVPLLDALEVPG